MHVSSDTWSSVVGYGASESLPTLHQPTGYAQLLLKMVQPRCIIATWLMLTHMLWVCTTVSLHSCLTCTVVGDSKKSNVKSVKRAWFPCLISYH